MTGKVIVEDEHGLEAESSDKTGGGLEGTAADRGQSRGAACG